MESNINNGKNNANQKEAKNGPISDFQGKEVNCHISKQLVIHECTYYVHPIYNLYAASRDGQIIHIMQLKVFDSTAKL